VRAASAAEKAIQSALSTGDFPSIGGYPARIGLNCSLVKSQGSVIFRVSLTDR
jgi:hypothetical protein